MLAHARASNPGGKFTERPPTEYLALLEHLDNEVGRLLRRLDELALAERTVVIFASDNGGLSRVTSNGPLREGKGSPYEGGIRVPLIVRWPGQIKPGTLCEVPVWGWAAAGTEVTVEFAGQKKTAVADATGKWLVRLDALKASSEARPLRRGLRPALSARRSN